MDSTWNVILNQCLDPVIQTHLSKTAAKLKTRKSQQRNLKACSFFMGAKAKALRTSTLLLNTAACPVGSRSSHTNLIDCQLNRTMQLISGCLHPTETQWLPMPANIHPQNLQQQSAVNKMLSTLDSHQDWLVHAGVFSHPSQWLCSRHPIWLDVSPVDRNTQWKDDWQSASVTNCVIVVSPTSRQPGFDLPRCSWSMWNCFRTGQGTRKASMYKWGWQSHQTDHV